MAEAFTFMMGKFPALLPGDLRYCRNHMWCRPESALLRFGFTAYAVRAYAGRLFSRLAGERGRFA